MTRALIVDDHEENLYFLRSLLEANGFEVLEARHGAEALSVAERSPPHIVISDLLMPEVDGYTLLRQWRASDRFGDIPFIVYTATYTEPKDERLAMALGADAFVIKPQEPGALHAVIEDIMAKHARGELEIREQRAVDEQYLLREYNEVLVRKLETKAMEVEKANRELRTEIAERRAAEERLRDSEERYRATFEQAAVGIAHVSREGQFLRVNERLCAMTGYSREELLELRFVDLTHPDEREEGEAARAGMLAGQRTVFAVEKRYICKNGDPVWVNVVTTLLRDQAGRPDYFVTVVVDLSDRKLLEDQLRQAQKMEAIGRLAGGIAHDFNNLLTIIIGCTDLLTNLPGLRDADRELVSAIGEASDRATDLTRQLLGFSRRTMLQPKVVNMNEVVDGASRMLGRLLDVDVTLTCVLAPDLANVRVDPNQLDQVLLNLAINAKDAMPDGGQLTIETANVELDDSYIATHLDCKPGPHVLLAVSDTGSGMPPDVIARVFEPYYTTKEAGKGTGLGLPMVFGIVQQSGGCIHVYSEPGHGTTFKIYLPVVGGWPEAVDVQPVSDEGLWGSETILLVEDDDAVRSLAVRTLEARGYRLLVARDGHEALQLATAAREPIDLLLSDIVMPKLSGPELAQRLGERSPGMKVLFMSGYTDDAVVRHGLLSAEVAFIQKPYRPSLLALKVRSVLDQPVGAGVDTGVS